jgi:hypothetical protein
MWLRLSRCEEAWTTSEALILRHQLSVMQRGQPHRPKLNWADRALLAAAPLKPLPQPAGLGQRRIRKRACADGLINEYRLVA